MLIKHILKTKCVKNTGLNSKKAISVILIAIIPFVEFILFENVLENLVYVFANFNVVILNALLWYVLYLGIFVITADSFATTAVLSIVSYVIAVANYYVTQFRGTPIMPVDINSIATAGKVAAGYSYNITSNMVISILGLLVINTLAFFSRIKCKKIKTRLLLLILTLLAVGLIYTGELYSLFDMPEVDFVQMRESYSNGGYFATTLNVMRYYRAQIPENYSIDNVEYIDSLISDAESDYIAKALPDNIIIIMNESLCDLSVLGELNTQEEILPYIKGAEELNVGIAMSSAYGGGTANSEWEFLTGNTVAFIPNGTVAYNMYVKEGAASILDAMKLYNYKCIAYHPFEKTNYNRTEVYNIFGFDEFYGQEDYDGELVRNYVSDLSDYKNIIKMCEENDGRLFIFNVTMQNHSGYDDANYENNVSIEDYPGEFPMAEQYLGLVNESDRAFEYLIKYFSKSDEKTLILMFGDHQPKLEDEFYTAVRNDDEIQKLFATIYVAWANYNIDYDWPGVASLNYLGIDMLEALGMELTDYEKFVLMSQDYIPYINVNGYADNAYVTHQITSTEDSIINTYNILQYNNLFDNNRVDSIYKYVN